MKDRIENVIAAIGYIEDHLSEPLNLDTVAGAVHYSKYHLHRTFVKETGLTIHSYAQRRQLTEAAKLLVFSDKPIIEIALTAGYESRQAFTAIFKEMYKKTPHQYRKEKEFYPLQLRYRLQHVSVKDREPFCWKERITLAANEDISQWMELVQLVIDGFLYLNEKDYTIWLEDSIRRRQALILKAHGAAAGVLAFHKETGRIDFMGVHPQYRRRGIGKALIWRMVEELEHEDTAVSVTTFREGDKADNGYRDAFKNLGFAGAELLMEFGYPTQRLVLQKERLEAAG